MQTNLWYRHHTEKIIYRHTPDEERETHVSEGLMAGGRAQMVWDPEATLSIIKVQLLKNR